MGWGEMFELLAAGLPEGDRISSGIFLSTRVQDMGFGHSLLSPNLGPTTSQ